MTGPTREQVGDHHRHMLAALNAIHEQDPILIAVAARMLAEHSHRWMLAHIGFLTRTIYQQYDRQIEEYGDTWPDMLQGMARAGAAEYGHDEPETPDGNPA